MIIALFLPSVVLNLNVYLVQFAIMVKSSLMIFASIILNAFRDAAIPINALTSKIAFKNARLTQIAKVNAALMNIVLHLLFVLVRKETAIIAIKMKNVVASTVRKIYA